MIVKIENESIEVNKDQKLERMVLMKLEYVIKASRLDYAIYRSTTEALRIWDRQPLS